MHGLRDTLQPYHYERTCFSCDYNVIKRKIELTKIQRNLKFFNRLNYAEKKIVCFCIHIYEI